MDARKTLSNSIARILRANKINIPNSVADKLNALLGKYDINRAGASTGTLADHIKRFISAKRVDGLSPKTLIDYNQQLTRFSLRVNKITERITADDVRSYITAAYDRGLKDTTVCTIINTLKSFYSWLYAEDIIKMNPMLRIKSAHIDKKHLRKALSYEDIEMLRLNCQTKRDKAIFEVFYSSGCRLSELLNLNKSDVDFNECSLRVIGKGNKERVTFISPKAKIVLLDYLASRKDDGNALFVSKTKPYGRLKTRTIQRDIERIGKCANIKRVHPHLLRHSFASHALTSGMDITIIQQILGHDRIDTTQIYAKVSNASIKHAYSKLMF